MLRAGGLRRACPGYAPWFVTVPVRDAEVALSEVRIERESETPAGWELRAVLRRGGQERRHVLMLSYQDYELWCHGMRPPSDVGQSLLEIVWRNVGVEHVPDPLPERFDAGIVRRWLMGVDREMKESWLE